MIKNYDNEDQMEEEFDKIYEINEACDILKMNVIDARAALEEAQEEYNNATAELEEFEAKYKDILII